MAIQSRDDPGLFIEFLIYLSKDFDHFYIESFSLFKRDGYIELGVRLEFNFDDWANAWSIREHLRCLFFEIHEIGKTLEFSNTKYDDLEWEYYDTTDVDIGYNFNEDDGPPFFNRISDLIGILQKAHDNTLENFRNEVIRKVVIQRFSFPEEVKVACEQYLLYFIEFLHDLGVEASSSLREDSGDVLFIIEPKDKGEALEKIKFALEIYLRLPGDSNFSVVNSFNMILPVQRLGAQIQFLQGQLTLASATLQQKDFVIDQQSQLIQAQQFQIQCFSPKILLDSKKPSNKEDADKESLVGSYLSIKEYDWGPFNLGLPELVRYLKKIFSEGK